jgi:pimeloyl-ACP methyl ester carboxylesterase
MRRHSAASISRRILPALLVALVVGLSSMPAAIGKPPDPEEIIEVAVNFRILNANTSKVSCQSNGERNGIAGSIIAKRGALTGNGPKTATIYLHGFDSAYEFWDFNAVPGYNYAHQMAAAGHISVVVDRLGYPRSGTFQGWQICLGSHADMASQMVEQLRAGTYDAHGEPTPSFDKVVLAGHSIGGSIAQIEAYSYSDSATKRIDGLVVMAYADQGSSSNTDLSLARGLGDCAQQGGPITGSGYAYFIQTEEESKAALFHDAEPAVMDAQPRTRNPCGDLASIVSATAENQQSIPEIQVPVLLVYGNQDKVFPPPAGNQQKDRFTGTNDVTFVNLEGYGHSFTLERAENATGGLRHAVSDWLTEHDFSGPAPVGARSPDQSDRTAPAFPSARGQEVTTPAGDQMQGERRQQAADVTSTPLAATGGSGATPLVGLLVVGLALVLRRGRDVQHAIGSMGRGAR